MSTTDRPAPLTGADIDALRERVRAEIAAHPRGAAAVAERCGVSRSAVSMFAAGTYPAGEGRLAGRIAAGFERAAVTPATAVPAAAPAGAPVEMDAAGIEAVRERLTAAIAADPRGTSGVATLTGLSRSTLSQFSRGCYPGNNAHVAAHVAQQLDGWTCPHTQLRIQREACHATATAPAPTHRPDRMAQWSACQRCPHKPTTK